MKRQTIKTKTLRSYFRIKEILLPFMQSLIEISTVLEFGATKHPKDEWRQRPITHHIEQSMNHLKAYFNGQAFDAESQLHHLAHCICRLIFILQMELENNAGLRNKGENENDNQ